MPPVSTNAEAVASTRSQRAKPSTHRALLNTVAGATPQRLGAARRYPQAVSIGVFEIALTPGEAFFVDRDSEFLRDGVDVVDVQMDERVRNSVTRVLRQEKPDPSPCNGNKPREARLELMLPLFTKAEPLVPRDGACRIFDAENWNDFLVHDLEANKAAPSYVVASLSAPLGPAVGLRE
jgi:hypothetical protein